MSVTPGAHLGLLVNRGESHLSVLAVIASDPVCWCKVCWELEESQRRSGHAPDLVHTCQQSCVDVWEGGELEAVRTLGEVCEVVDEVAWFCQRVALGLGHLPVRRAAPLWLGRQAVEGWPTGVAMEMMANDILTAT